MSGCSGLIMIFSQIGEIIYFDMFLAYYTWFCTVRIDKFYHRCLSHTLQSKRLY